MKQILLNPPPHVKMCWNVAPTGSIVSDSIAAVKKHRGIPF